MLKPRKNKLFEQVFAIYNRNLLRRRFEGFLVKGLREVNSEPERPRIIVANHSTWWDGLIAFEVSRRAGLDAYVMMEERQLRRYALFRRLGAFSVETRSSRSAYRSIDFAARLLDTPPAKALWLFPQGEIRPASRRPLDFRRGVAALAARVPEALVVPFAIRCEFAGEFKPWIFAEAGTPRRCSEFRSYGRKTIADQLESGLGELLSRLEADIAAGDASGFEELIR